MGLSISFGITEILEFRLLDLRVALFYEFESESAIARSSFQFTSYTNVGVFFLTGKSANHVTPSFQFCISLFYILKAGAFFVQASLEPSTTHIPYDVTSLAKFFPGKLKLASSLSFCVKRTVFLIFQYDILSSFYLQPASQAIEADAMRRSCPSTDSTVI